MDKLTKLRTLCPKLLVELEADGISPKEANAVTFQQLKTALEEYVKAKKGIARAQKYIEQFTPQLEKVNDFEKFVDKLYHVETNKLRKKIAQLRLEHALYLIEGKPNRTHEVKDQIYLSRWRLKEMQFTLSNYLPLSKESQRIKQSLPKWERMRQKAIKNGQLKSEQVEAFQ